MGKISTKTLILIVIVVVIAASLIIFLGGYLGGEPITSAQEATQTITDVSSGVEDMARALEDIDNSLG